MNNKFSTKENRKCEIYKITNRITNKVYIGQTVSHILNHKKYRRYGAIGRFKCHISEAFSNKKKQCIYLNNSIRKYGKENFYVELIKICEIKDADKVETDMIKQYNSLFPNGYNIKNGGQKFQHDNLSRKKVSDGIIKYYNNYRKKKMLKIKIPSNIVPESIIKPLNRNGNQYGWYIYYKKQKMDFGGVHISLEESKKKAIECVKQIQQGKLCETP
jgi:hypothetical protein